MSEDNDSRKVQVLHQCEHRIVIKEEDGSIRDVPVAEDGQALPPNTQVVELSDCGEPGYMTMRTLYRTSGPAKVNSRQYKSGWEAVFNKEKRIDPKDLN